MRKSHRHRLIARLISANPVRSQEQLRGLLEAAGVRATQGTISRDLRDLGVLKSPSGYTLSNESVGTLGRAASDLERAVRAHLLSAEFAASVVVLKTEPGHAALLAGEIDRSLPAGVVGSIAGDDTVFLATRSPKVARATSLNFAKLAGIL